MRILYVAMKYDYGKPEQGYSFEHYNFYHSLLHMGHDILYFDFMSLKQEHGREWMNRRLREITATEKPDLLFCALFFQELDKSTIRDISENSATVTLNWFCDDHWRFDSYSRYWAPCFNWVVTTAASALPKYASTGYQNVIKSQWACNHFLYCKVDLPLRYDVTFVGQPHGNRREVVLALRDAGIDVHTWGRGWESGRISQDEMIRLFNQSRINLNLSNASMPISPLSKGAKGAAVGWVSRSLDGVPLGVQLKAVGRGVLSRVTQVAPSAKRLPSPDTYSQQYTDQIKGRNFEVPGCGGFLLTGQAEDLGSYYEIGKEIICFDDVDDLVDKVRHYLRHEDEREAIARAGYDRTLREHTYVHRFTEIFQQLGLPCQSPEAVLGGSVRPGQTEEVL